MNRLDALSLMKEYTKNPNLRKHMLSVEAAMRAYALVHHEDPEWWGIAGLLHDFDYEQYPDLSDHPFRGSEILRQRGYPDDLIATIRAHAPHTGEVRDTPAQKAIFEVDELCGFIVAVALIKPSKSLAEVDIASVRKKLGNKGFARQINRTEIQQGADELGRTLDDHIDIVLRALQSVSTELGL